MATFNILTVISSPTIYICVANITCGTATYDKCGSLGAVCVFKTAHRSQTVLVNGIPNLC